VQPVAAHLLGDRLRARRRAAFAARRRDASQGQQARDRERGQVDAHAVAHAIE
jgi:hypothetical protein